MILDELSLVNIRSHRDTLISFPKGITLFSGHIGSGKSTVLMGIEFALFGLSSIKSESLLSIGESTGEVSLKFSVDDTSYHVKRTLKRNRNKVSQDSRGTSLQVNGIDEPLTASQLKTRILEILGLNEPSGANSKSRIYRYAIFTPQDEMKSILWDREKRLDTIRKIFHMEDYEIARKNAEPLRQAIRDSIFQFQGRFENLERLRSDLADAKQRHQQYTDIIRERTSMEQDLAGQEHTEESEANHYKARAEEKADLRTRHAKNAASLAGEEQMQRQHETQIRDNNQHLESLRQRLRMADEATGTRPTSKSMIQIQTEINRFTKQQEIISEKRFAIVSLQKQAESLKTRLSGRTDTDMLRRELDDNTSKLNLAQEALDVLRRDRNDNNDSQVKARAEISRLESGIADLQSLGAKCRLCGHELTPEHLAGQARERQDLLAKERQNLDALKADQTSQDAGIVDAETGVKTLRDAISSISNILLPGAEDYNRLLSDVENHRAELKRLDTGNTIQREPDFEDVSGRTPVAYLLALKEALAGYESGQRRVSDMKTEMTRLESANLQLGQSLEQSRVRSQDLATALDGISVQLDAYAGDDEKASAVRQRLDGIRQSLRRVRDEIATGNANLANENTQINRLESEILDAEHWQKVHHKYRQYLDWLMSYFVPSMSQIEKDVMVSTRHTFNESYRNWYKQLVVDDTKDSVIDEEFAPVVHQDGYKQSLEYLSGGEKASVALSYRLALNFVMRQETSSLKSNLLILDEPTDGFSRDQLVNVKDFLKDLDSKQIILVSHDPELKSSVDHVFSVKKSSGVTAVTRE